MTSKTQRWASTLAVFVGIVTGSIVGDVLTDFGVGRPARYFALSAVVVTAMLITYRLTNSAKLSRAR
jgi:hypothetical protein